MVKEQTTLFAVGHRNWPWPRYNEPIEQTAQLYRKSMEFMIGSELLSMAPYTEGAFTVFDQYALRLVEEGRWKNYQTAEMGDMNVGTHSLRQAAITLQALSYGDAQKFQLPPAAVDMMSSAAVIHDLGELHTTDITYDLKQQDKRTLELAESVAVFSMIDQVAGVDPATRSHLKEIYMRISSSLSAEDIQWDTMRKLFGLYERYGYLITAIEQYPFSSNVTQEQIPAEELEQMRTWNRPELEAAMESGSIPSAAVRQAVLFKNVVGNQWSKIMAADTEGIPSARLLFDNNMTHSVFTHANDLKFAEIPMAFFDRL